MRRCGRGRRADRADAAVQAAAPPLAGAPHRRLRRAAPQGEAQTLPLGTSLDTAGASLDTTRVLAGQALLIFFFLFSVKR